MRYPCPVAVALIAVASACGPAIRVDFDPAASFGALKTYAWTDSAATHRRQLEEESPFLEQRLRRAIDRVLEERGFRAVTGAENPDFLVSAFVVGPIRPVTRSRLWATGPCVGEPGIRFGITIPFGWSRRTPYFQNRPLYWWNPLGYACSYRLGFGYVWIPLYEPPGSRMPGTLVVEVMDPGKQELLWRGWTEGGLLNREASSEEKLDDLVARVLAKFPPGEPR